MMILMMKKARGRRGRLVPVKKQVSRDGKSFMQTVWISPDETQGQSAKAQTQFAEVTARYQGTPQWLKAPNGRPSKLTKRQWVRVRTPLFKKWFGDWERKAILEGNVIKAVKSASIPMTGKGPIDAARQWLKNNPQGTVRAVTVDGIFDVEIDSGIKDSFSHYVYPNKVHVLPAIKDIIERGAYLEKRNDLEKNPIDNYFFAAPVSIDGHKQLVFVRVRHARGDKPRFYVHEVYTENEIKQFGGKQPQGMQTFAVLHPHERYKTILKNAYDVKNVSAALDENGEPQVTRIDGKDYFVNTRTGQQKPAGGTGPAAKSDSSLNKSVALLYCRKTGRYLFKRIGGCAF